MSSRSSRSKPLPIRDDIAKSLEDWKKIGKKGLVLKCGEANLSVEGRVVDLAERLYLHYQNLTDFYVDEDSEKADTDVFRSATSAIYAKDRLHGRIQYRAR